MNAPLTPEREHEIRTLDLLALMDDRSAPVISGHLAALLHEVDQLRAGMSGLHARITELEMARSAVIADRDAQIIAWLVKKAREEGTSNKERRTKADTIFRLADKLSRGAVRPPISKGPDPLLTGAERQFLTFALELAADQMASRSNEFDDEDAAALQALRRVAATGGAR